MTEDRIPPSKQAYKEALKLADEIMRNIELAESSLTLITLKVIRLARLTNDFEMMKILELEISGYTVNQNGYVPKEQWEIGLLANRQYHDESNKEKIFPESVEHLEDEKNFLKSSIQVAGDADISITSSNPRHFPKYYTGNATERVELRARFKKVSERLASRRSMIYQYILRKYLELRYSNIAEDIFSRIQEKVYEKIGKYIPDSVKRFNAVYENLRSENSENWSNAVHSCRRILKDLADAIYPSKEAIQKEINGKEITIQLDEDHFINRILEFITQKSNSKTYNIIVGSHLKFIEDRLNSILGGSHKGTHKDITDKEEANRIVVYTYLLIGDILALV